MNLMKAKDYELIAELKRRKILSTAMVATIIRNITTHNPSFDSTSWIKNNPQVFSRLESMALEMAAQGKKASSRLLVERIRSEKIGSIPNAITKCLNKVLVEKHPELNHLFM